MPHGLRELLGPVQNSLRELCLSLVTGLSESGALRSDLSIELETERLHALVDGLSLHVAIQPSRTTPARVRELLRQHLNSLRP